jgi:hypothetical protein
LFLILLFKICAQAEPEIDAADSKATVAAEASADDDNDDDAEPTSVEMANTNSPPLPKFTLPPVPLDQETADLILEARKISDRCKQLLKKKRQQLRDLEFHASVFHVPLDDARKRERDLTATRNNVNELLEKLEAVALSVAASDSATSSERTKWLDRINEVRIIRVEFRFVLCCVVLC